MHVYRAVCEKSYLESEFYWFLSALDVTSATNAFCYFVITEDDKEYAVTVYIF